MTNPLSLAERCILVTGASSGIGRQTAVLVSQLGASLILVGRHRERLDQTLRMLEGQPHRIEVFDLRVLVEIPGWLKRVSGNTGPIHGLVHCAGIQATASLKGLNLAEFDDIMRMNCGTALTLAKGFRQKGVAAAAASLVFVSSVMGMVGSAGRAIYSASKGALDALARCLAIELAREGLRVNCIAPAFVRSEMWEQMHQVLLPEQLRAIEAAHPLGLGETQDVANAAAFLLANSSRWITGTTLVVDGGYTAQ